MKALVVGGSVVDVIVESDHQGLYSPGSKVDVNGITFGIGGGATNVALTLTKLGAKVSIHCGLGNDREGQHICDQLRTQNVDVSRIKLVSDAPTGRAVIVLDKSGEVSVLAERGANKYFVPVLNREDKNFDLLYLSSVPLDALREFEVQLSNLQDRKFKFAMNPGLAQIQSGNDSLLKLVYKTDLLILNGHEALELTGKLSDQSAIELSPNDLAKRLVDLNLNTVIVTDGPNGAYIASRDSAFFQSNAPAHVRSTIGAGDTFGATFAYYIVTGAPFETAAHYAALNAASVVGSVDANGGALAKESLEKSLDLPNPG